jgi:ABC-type phosphate transport system substrate-binding protein
VFTKQHLPSNFYNDNGTGLSKGTGSTGYTGGCKGSGGVQLCIDGTPGAIGYISPDFVQPIVTGNDKLGNAVPVAANIQTYASYSAGSTAIFLPPTAKAAGISMAAAAVPTGSNITNPLAWGVVNPTPSAAAGYPIAGFTFIDMYSCYAAPATVDALVGKVSGANGLFTWYFGNGTTNGGVPASTLSANGFAPVPSVWATAINSLLATNTATKIGTPNKAGTACASVANGA